MRKQALFISALVNAIVVLASDEVAFSDIQWNEAFEKAGALVSVLSLDEKIGLVTGAKPRNGTGCAGNIESIDRVNFTGLCLQDGANGIALGILTSTFPSGVTTVATWDKELIEARGLALGEEFRGKGIQGVLGPVAGPLGRSPLGGRNWESFGVDPYLSGIAMDISIRAIQKSGVQAVAKHFLANEQETQRTNTTVDGIIIDAVSTNLDDRTLHELYLWPFADSVRAGASSMMCSYNRLNQTYACEHPELLTSILKEELGFRGWVVSDWYATHAGAASANAGLDMEMPGPISDAYASYFGSKLKRYIEDGSLTENRLDQMAERVLAPYYLLGQDTGFPTLDPSTFSLMNNEYRGWGPAYGLPEMPGRDVRGNHSALIRSIGAAGTVLLKNIDGILPLVAPKNIGVFGNDAGDLTEGFKSRNPAPPYGFEYGTLNNGGGAASTHQTSLVSPLEAIKKKAEAIGALGNLPHPEVCLVFLKTFSAEGFDRPSFENDWNSTTVVNNVADRCPKTVVITHSSGVNTLPWANHTNVKAILAAHYPGESSGDSIVDILWGKVNPSGRLPYTIPVKASDYDIPVVTQPIDSSPSGWQVDFTEGLLVDYRHFDAHDIEPLYEFGFGLSYSSFDVVGSLSINTTTENLTAVVEAGHYDANTEAFSQGGHPDLWKSLISATVDVKNTGEVSGATVVQLYVALPQEAVPAGTPIQVLRGFEKVYLDVGETKSVKFELRRRDISYWDVKSKSWVIPKGPIGLRAGFSSRDIRAKSEATVI